MAERTPTPLDLDAELRALQDRLSDLGFVVNVIIDLRREAFKLLHMLPDELHELKQHVGRLLPLLVGAREHQAPYLRTGPVSAHA